MDDGVGRVVADNLRARGGQEATHHVLLGPEGGREDGREKRREGGREEASRSAGLPSLDEYRSLPYPSLPPSLPPYLPPQPVKKHRALPAPRKSIESAAAAREENVRSATKSSTPWHEAAAAAATSPPMLSPWRPTWIEGGREGGRGSQVCLCKSSLVRDDGRNGRREGGTEGGREGGK